MKQLNVEMVQGLSEGLPLTELFQSSALGWAQTPCENGSLEMDVIYCGASALVSLLYLRINISTLPVLFELMFSVWGHGWVHGTSVIRRNNHFLTACFGTAGDQALPTQGQFYTLRKYWGWQGAAFCLPRENKAVLSLEPCFERHLQTVCEEMCVCARPDRQIACSVIPAPSILQISLKI